MLESKRYRVKDDLELMFNNGNDLIAVSYKKDDIVQLEINDSLCVVTVQFDNYVAVYKKFEFNKYFERVED